MQSPQPFHQLQMLTPQQQQLFFQTQNMASTQGGDIDSRRLKMFLNNKNMIIGKDCQSSSSGDIIPNAGSPMQNASPILPRGEADMFIKVCIFL